MAGRAGGGGVERVPGGGRGCDAPAGDGGHDAGTSGGGEQEAGCGAGLGGEGEAAGRRDLDGVEHGEDEADRRRPQAFLDGGEDFGRAAGLDEDEAVGVEARSDEAGTIGAADVGDGGIAGAEEDGRRCPAGRWRHLQAADGEAQGERECCGTRASGGTAGGGQGRLDLVHAGDVEATDQMAVDLGRAETPTAMHRDGFVCRGLPCGRGPPCAGQGPRQAGTLLVDGDVGGEAGEQGITREMARVEAGWLLAGHGLDGRILRSRIRTGAGSGWDGRGHPAIPAGAGPAPYIERELTRCRPRFSRESSGGDGCGLAMGDRPTHDDTLSRQTR